MQVTFRRAAGSLPEQAAKNKIHVMESCCIYQTPQPKNGSQREHSRFRPPRVNSVVHRRISIRKEMRPQLRFTSGHGGIPAWPDAHSGRSRLLV